MSSLDIGEGEVVVDGNRIHVGAPVLDARITDSVVLVLIDPDSYLNDPDYRTKRRQGLSAVRNLRAFSLKGAKLWEAEMPEEADYYHKIVSTDPIEVASFSSFNCRINPKNGKIVWRQFTK